MTEPAAPVEDLADDQPEHVQINPLELAGQLLVEALGVLRSPAARGENHTPAWRLSEKIALSQAFAAHAQAAAAQLHAQVAHQQLQLMLEARQLAAGKQGGPAASLVVPTINLGGR